MSGLVEAARFYNSVEAEMARSMLATIGIEAVVFDGAMSAYTAGGLIPVRLMVLDDELADAQAALADPPA